MSVYLTKTWNEEAEKMMGFLDGLKQQEPKEIEYSCPLSDDQINALLEKA